MPAPAPLEPRLFRMDPVGPVDPDGSVESDRAGGEQAWAPVLLGSRCPETGQVYWPRRRLGATSMVPTEDVDLSGHGILYSWTYVHVPWFGQSQMDSAGFGVGQVDLPEGVRVQCVITGETGDWGIGMPMEIHYDIVEEREGDPIALFRFRPAGSAPNLAPNPAPNLAPNPAPNRAPEERPDA